MAVVTWCYFCELSQSAKFHVCITVPSGLWPSFEWLVTILGIVLDHPFHKRIEFLVLALVKTLHHPLKYNKALKDFLDNFNFGKIQHYFLQILPFFDVLITGMK